MKLNPNLHSSETLSGRHTEAETLRFDMRGFDLQISSSNGQNRPRSFIGQPLTSALLTLAMLALTSCGGLFSGSGEQVINTYTLSLRHFDQVPQTNSDIVLLVSPMQSAGYDSRQMSYSAQTYEQTYYARAQWADAPPRLIEPLLTQVLETSGIFESVVNITSTVLADIKLDMTLLILQHEFHLEPSQARIVMRVQLTDLHSRKILATRIFEQTQRAPTESPYGGVAALNLALENMLYEISLFCGEILSDWSRPERVQDRRDRRTE